MTGNIQMMLGGGGGLIQNFTAWNVTSGGVADGVPSCPALWFNSDGTVSRAVTGGNSIGTDGTPYWFLPLTAGIGAGYWIKATLTGGTGTLDSGNVGTWNPLSANVGWQMSVSTSKAADKNAIFTLQISNSATGTPVLWTSTGNQVSRQHT